MVTAWIRDKLIERGLPPECVLLLTNGVNITKFCPLPQAQARAELGWDNRFTVLYIGTCGVTHGLIAIIDVAEQLQDHEDICFVLAGDGADKHYLITESQRRGLKNITFLDPMSHDLVPTLLAAGDVCLAHVRKAPITEGILPIKMFEAMACARPIVLGVDGEARHMAVDEAGAAIYVEPENAAALASAVLYLYEHPELARELGARGRAYAEAYLDYDRLTAILDERIAMLLEKKEALI